MDDRVTTQRVTYTLTDGVADVRLVRADKMNALDKDMFEALVSTTERLTPREGPARCGDLGRGPRVLRRSRHGQLFAHGEGHLGHDAAAASAISACAPTARPTPRSRRCGAGGNCRCP